jgi:hypothetical protein
MRFENSDFTAQGMHPLSLPLGRERWNLKFRKNWLIFIYTSSVLVLQYYPLMWCYIQFVTGYHISFSKQVRHSTHQHSSVCLLIQPFWLLTSADGLSHRLALAWILFAFSWSLLRPLFSLPVVVLSRISRFACNCLIQNFTNFDSICLHNSFPRTCQALNTMLLPSVRQH